MSTFYPAQRKGSIIRLVLLAFLCLAFVLPSIHATPLTQSETQSETESPITKRWLSKREEKKNYTDPNEVGGSMLTVSELNYCKQKSTQMSNHCFLPHSIDFTRFTRFR